MIMMRTWRSALHLSGPGGPRSGKKDLSMRRIHPFVYGHVVAALIIGVAVDATLNAQAAGMGAAMLTAGAIVSSMVCWWKPGFEAPAWLLIPAAILANPLMLLALGFMVVDADCLVGGKTGWNCLGAALLTAAAIVSSVVCWWKPGFEAPAWLLIPAAILANPLMLVALGFIAIDSGCLVGSKRGWDCLAAALAILVAGVCLVPPFGGWLWRWWKRRGAQAT